MAPQKRPRFEDEDEIISVVQASSSFRQGDGQRKKARVSAGPRSSKSDLTHSPSVPSSDSGSNEEVQYSYTNNDDGPVQTQHEAARDHWEDYSPQTQALDDAWAEKKHQERLQRNKTNKIGDNAAADNAIIEKITCQNFMCHDLLSVELGPLINFIVGENGSGKSAVLTAITLCLGGKASATNRGSSLKSLIKEGTDKAVLKVTLKNGGTDAYQKDLYGDKIIVERSFTTSGSSGFKLKNSADHTVSTKKSDVDDLIEYYQLQVDNPMNVLTQDAAKSFIQTSTPKEKYEFFVQGVQLQQLDNDYKLVSDTCQQIEDRLLDSKENIDILKKELDKAEQRAKISDQFKNMRIQMGIMGKQLAWAQVVDQENILKERQRDATEAEVNVTQGEKAIEERSTAYEIMHRKLEQAEENLEQTQDDLAPLELEETTALEAWNQVQAEVRMAESIRVQIRKDLSNAEKLVTSCQHDVDAEKKRIEDANGGASARKQAEIDAAEIDLKDATEALESHQETRQELDKENAAAYEASKKYDSQLRAKNGEIKDYQGGLRELEASRGNHMAGYGPHMATLLKRIQADGGFRERPVGPMGLHVKLLKPEWSSMIESIIGNLLMAFVVTSKQDQVRLAQLMQGVIQNPAQRPQILIGNGALDNFSMNEPDPQFDTILRVLEIDNNLVRKQLMIVAGIDQTILVRSRSEGQRVMFDGPKLQNVRVCFTPHDSKQDWAQRLSIGGNGATETTGQKLDLKSAPRMKTDTESQITLQKQRLSNAQREKSEIDEKICVRRDDYRRTDEAIKQHESDRKQLRIRVQRAQERVDELQAEFDVVNITDGALDALKISLTEAEADVKRLEDDYGSQSVQIDEVNKIASAKKRSLKGARLVTTEQRTKVEKAQNRIKQTTSARNTALGEKNFACEEIDTLRKRKATAGQAVADQEEQVASFTEQAAAVSPERMDIEVGTTFERLEQKYDKFRKQLKEHHNRQGANDTDVYAQRNEAQARFNQANANYMNQAELLQLLKFSYDQRLTMFRYFRRYISSRSRVLFSYMLHERAFRGDLMIDHKSKLLDVRVEPDNTKKSGKGHSTKALSGGEKSFSSICLLLSLWEAMGAPLRCLDEYDVFMDDVNRDVSARMIVTAARRSVGKQFILITPKALAKDIEAAADVKISRTRLRDPRAKQTAIEDYME
ncbi:hypothetical protein BJ878DRAFT_579613 [Calycina marina]|uniref:Rad50/SbcC-type AAA domain-containing protein n=1 Tax=Calycina marina TaxID=1763456 RepID=A0A9P7ZCB9_9HELO|nr:hypothetical protein BJ878DRAFT_579613 [Calycina marina]